MTEVISEGVLLRWLASGEVAGVCLGETVGEIERRLGPPDDVLLPGSPGELRRYGRLQVLVRVDVAAGCMWDLLPSEALGLDRKWACSRIRGLKDVGHDSLGLVVTDRRGRQVGSRLQFSDSPAGELQSIMVMPQVHM